MKYFVWFFIFVIYLLMVIGLFLIIDSALSDFEFAESGVFYTIFGGASIFIALCGAYITADYLSKCWHGEHPNNPDKKKDTVKWIVFIITFTVVFTLFKLHDTFFPELFPNAASLYFSIKIGIFRINLHEFFKFFILPFEVDNALSLLSLRGIFFMCVTITLTYVFTAISYKRLNITVSVPETAESEG